MSGGPILVSALCTDTYVASLACGANRAHAGWGKVALLNGICSGHLDPTLGLGSVIGSALLGGVTETVYFVSPLLLGFVKLLDYSVEVYINRHCCIRRDLSFSLSGLRVIVNIYGDPIATDVDGSQSPRWKEAVFLTPTMPINSLVAGTMAVLLNIFVAATSAPPLAMGVCTMYGGLWPGRKVAPRFRCDPSWINGVLLMALALMEVLP